MYKYSLFLAFVFSIISINETIGQTKSINYNVQTNLLNEGVPIPAEEPFIVKGVLPSNIHFVKLDIYKNKKKKNPDYKSEWKRAFNFAANEYELLVNNPLHSNDDFIFVFSYYTKASIPQLKMLQQALHNSADAFIDANYEARSNGIISHYSKQVVKNNLNTIVNEGASSFKQFSGIPFNGFSDIVSLKIDKLQKARLRNARFNVFGLGTKNAETKAAYAAQLIKELKDLVKSEIDQYLSDNMLVLVDIREVKVSTEKTFSSLPLNIGYGALYFGGGTQNLDYASSPYLGMSLHLGNQVFTRFLGNASISTGVMLNNMSNNNGELVSGPIVDRPIYLALGYRALRIFRFNAGTAVATTNAPGANSQTLHAYAFFGLSLEINLWLGFNKRK